MITNWTYTDVPQGIDLTIPLMPHRDARDMTIYGVDVAWQNEVLSAWRGVTPGKTEMPSGPSADFTNGIRFHAGIIKGYTGMFYADVPSAAFVTPPSAFVFSDVPAYVSKGDPVRRADVEDMFTWMDGVKYIKRTAAADYTIPTMTNAQYSEEGALEVTLPPDLYVQNPFYEWAWIYRQYWDDGDFGGKFRERKSADFSAAFAVSNAIKDCFSAAHVFALVEGALYAPTGSASPPGGVIEKLVYVPCASTAITQSGTGVTFSATVQVSAAVSALQSVAGLPSQAAYKDTDYMTRRVLPDSQITSGDYLWAAGLSEFVVFLELSPDFRV